MARLSDETVTRIKQDVSLLRLAEAKGFTLKKHGKDYAIHCPFHDGDKTPSLIISPDVNLFHCPACGAKGSPIDWVMRIEGVSTRHALELLANDLPGLAADHGEPPKVVKKSTQQKLPPLLSASADHQTALRQVADFYHQTLQQSPEALAYLEQRGLNHAELIDTFQLGYANRTLAYRLPEKNRKEGAELRGLLQDVGLLRASGHEHFNGCITVPILDEHGAITELYGRKINDNLRAGTAYHLYLPGPHVGVWNRQALPGAQEIILCEALIDAMTFWVHGFRNVTASYGTGGFTEDLLQALIGHDIQRVLIAYDRDDAGNKAAEQVAHKLMAHGLDCYRVLLPKGMDVNDYALQVQPAAKALGLVIRQAQWLGQGQAPDRADVAEAVPLAEPELLENQAAKEKISTQDAASSLAAEVALPLAAESLPAPPASRLPALPAAEIDAEVSEQEIKLALGPRLYRVRGLPKNLSYEQLKINLLVSQGDAVHVDQLDLYHAKARQSFIKQAAIELGVKDDVIKTDLGKVLLKLEALQDAQIRQALAKPENNRVKLTDEEQQAALHYLRDPALLDRLLADFDACGVVGEETNKLVGYLACVSRKLDKPLAVIIQSSSAAGKSSLMEAVLNLMPEEERIQYSAMTGQSLFYMGETNLKNKILAIAEEEGAEQASYALKLLQSDGQVSIASTGKNDVTGNLETRSYTVQGPVMLFLTTTAIDIDEELLNRCVVLTVNESREQTEAIHALQRKSQTLEGLLLQETKKHLTTLHRNLQRLIRPLKVVNPYAEQLTFLSDKTRTRRDHMKYLQLINSIALLHQYQRDVKTVAHQGEVIEYIEVTREDIAQANRLAHDVLGRSLDELPPQTRKLLQLIHAMVVSACQQEQIEQPDYRFTRKHIRDATGWGNTQLKVHLGRLEDMEYLLVHRGSRGNSLVYELLYSGDGETGTARLYGLIDTRILQYDEQKSGVGSQQSGSSRPQVGPVSGASRGAENAQNTTNSALNEKDAENPGKRTSLANKNNGQSYRSHTAPLAAHGVS